jgi:Ca2+-binding RTX toxin-like protein
VVQTPLPTSLAAGKSATFVIGMLTTAAGTPSGAISFTTNDSAVGTFNFNIKGSVATLPGEPPPFAVVQGTTLVVTGTDVKDIIGVDIKGAFIRAGLKGGELLSFPAANITAITIDAGAGGDTLTVETTITLPATLVGGTGKDVLLGGSGDDSLSGGGSNDKLVGRLGADILDGGSGIDTVEYTDRVTARAGVTASLNGTADDGATDEGDFILSNVENLLGGRGNDILIGNEANNLIAGARGADQIFGFGGDDVLFACQETFTTDGLADAIDGGDGTDTAVSDSLDVLTNVEG